MVWTAEEAVLAHSAKGTSWSKKDHKYIKKENGVYYYKDDYPHVKLKEAYQKIYDDETKAYKEHMDEYYRDNFYVSGHNKPNMSSEERNDVIRRTLSAKEEKALMNEHNETRKWYKEQYKEQDAMIQKNAENRSFSAKAEMKLAEIGDSIREAGERFLKKLGIR